VHLGIRGARPKGETPRGNSLLKLNKNYALGRKGTYVELPRDKVIYEAIRNYGSWELKESKFLSLGLITASSKNDSKVAFLDIGANSGLVSLQTMNLSKTFNEVFLFEPIPQHVSAIMHNLRNFSHIHINDFALSDHDGTAEMFTELTNFGNTSIFDTVVPEAGRTSKIINLVETSSYCDRFLNNFDKYVIKCDTQGMDALILSLFPERIWQKCQSAVIEVWALPEISNIDVEGVLSMFKGFDHVSWQPYSDEDISLSEVMEFWLSKSSASKNLFLSRNS
jgi:FkbM family methyltransferase